MTAASTVVLWGFICRPQSGSEGGLGWYWAEALTRRGHDVHLVTMPTFREEIEEQLSSQPGVLRLYDQADVFLYTGIRDTSCATGLEAAARGLPIVGLTHSGGGGCDDYQQRSKAILEFAAENTWDAKAYLMSGWYAELGRA